MRRQNGNGNGHRAFETQSLSNRQWSMLVEAEALGGVSLEAMLNTSQVTAGSVVRRGYLKWNSAVSQFVLTQAGVDVLEGFGSTDISRKTTWGELSKAIGNRDAVQMAVHLRAELKKNARGEK